MCSGAIVQARIDDVYFGAYDDKNGAVCSVQRMFDLPYNWKPQAQGGMMQAECSDVLSAFFRLLREKKRNLKKTAAGTCIDAENMV
jgi:tRNA(adenine34) deaminase